MSKQKKSTIIAKSKGIVLRSRQYKTVRTLYLDINKNGKRTYENLELYLTGDKKLDRQMLDIAKEIFAQRLIQLRRKDSDFINGNELNFIAYAESLNYKDGAYKACIKHLKIFSNGDLRFKKLDAGFINTFIQYLKTHIKPKNKSDANAINASVWLYLQILNVMVNRAVKDDIISKNNISKHLTIKKTTKKRIFLSEEEVRRIANVALQDQKDIIRQAFLFSCFTGLRFSDIIRLRYEDIADNAIHIRQKKTSDIVYIPLSNQAKKYIPRSEKNNGLIFNPFFSPNTVNYYLVVLCELADITKPVTFHTARHTFATMLLNRSVDVYTVQKLMGHANINTTMVYAHLLDKTKWDAIDKLPNFD